MTTHPNDMPADTELREQIWEKLGWYVRYTDRGQDADAVRVYEDLMQLIAARDAAIRIDELERCMEQTEMERHQNGYAVPYRFINDRIAELRRESEQATEERDVS